MIEFRDLARHRIPKIRTCTKAHVYSVHLYIICVQPTSWDLLMDQRDNNGRARPRSNKISRAVFLFFSYFIISLIFFFFLLFLMRFAAYLLLCTLYNVNIICTLYNAQCNPCVCDNIIETVGWVCLTRFYGKFCTRSEGSHCGVHDFASVYDGDFSKDSSFIRDRVLYNSHTI